ncbi:hypothetical protein AcW1_005952 [Taiwanofungus camphoratus]|nr:hypothetical protein AcW1_005952 [Antrodia cinnamomea]
MSATGQHPPCSNCSERGLKCVDEFAEVKAVKLLRRGRRLQQVEAVYGQSANDENSLHSVNPPRSVIPKLKPEFFGSPFFHRLHIQRPILEPMEFCYKYFEFCKGNKDVLDIPGQLIAMILVAWAASFGVNEFGVEELYDGAMSQRRTKERVNDMVQEILYLIDIHGILRKPSWDGVRALLLVLPLTQEVQSPMDRLIMYEATVSQVYALCSLASVSSVNSGQGEYVDALVRARIFWYAHIIDGVTSGLRGGRILLTDDDLSSFETTLPPLGDNSGSSANYAFAFRYATIPIRIASVCRQVHSALTGPRARQSHEVDEEKLHDAWDTLDRCWKQFDELRQFGTDGFVQAEDIDRFIDGWQIFVFECHNVIREALKQRLVARPPPDSSFVTDVHPTSRVREYEAVVRLHTKSNAKCHVVARHVVSILRRNVGTQLFQFDAALIRDGCLFAGFLLAGESGSNEDIEICLQALSEMRWAFSKSDEREQTVRMIWESRLAQPRSRSYTSSPTDDLLRPSTSEHPYTRRPLARPISVPPLTLSLNTIPSTLGSASAPSTACSADGDWPTSTPPTSAGTDMYSAPGTSHHSPSPPYAPPPQNGLDALRSKHAGLVPSPLALDSMGQPGRTGNARELDQIFYFQPYNYGGMGENADAHHAPHQPTILAGPAAPEQASSYTTTQYFDANAVVFSNAAIGPHPAGPGDIATSSAVHGDSRQFGNSGFYH